MQNQAAGQNRYLLRNQKLWIRGSHVLISLVGILVALNVVLSYYIFFSNQGIAGFRQQSQQVGELEAKIRKLKEENHRIFQQIQSFKNKPQAQERFVRRQLGWAKENEFVFEFLPSRKDSTNRK